MKEKMMNPIDYKLNGHIINKLENPKLMPKGKRRPY